MAEAEPERFVCLLIDQDMAEFAGLELLAQLRNIGVATPAVILTVNPNPALIERAAALGVQYVLEKPLVNDDVLIRIASAAAAK